VLCPTKDRNDGHPDLTAADGRLYDNLTLIVEGINALPSLLAALSVPNPDVERLRHKLRMIVSHATGGHSQDIDASINDICVRISENRNHVFAHGKEVGERETRAALADRP
jgi:hypothetical protein